MRVRVHAPFIIGLLFATVSCGGSESTPSATDAPSAADEPSATETAAPADEAPADEAAAPTTPPAPSGSNAAAGTGTITIGDLSHELTIIRCVAIAGAIGADAVSVSEPDNVDVNFSFSPENWQDRPASEGWTETGTARLDVDDPYQQWESGPSLLEVFNLPAGFNAADFDIITLDIADDGQSASGTANFVEINSLLSGGDVMKATGTFAFTCPN